MNRRGFLTGMGAVIAAPAVVNIASLMPVRGIVMPPLHRFVFRTSLPTYAWRQMYQGVVPFRPGLVEFDAPSKELAEIMFRDWQAA